MTTDSVTVDGALGLAEQNQTLEFHQQQHRSKLSSGVQPANTTLTFDSIVLISNTVTRVAGFHSA